MTENDRMEKQGKKILKYRIFLWWGKIRLPLGVGLAVHDTYDLVVYASLDGWN